MLSVMSVILFSLMVYREEAKCKVAVSREPQLGSEF